MAQGSDPIFAYEPIDAEAIRRSLIAYCRYSQQRDNVRIFKPRPIDLLEVVYRTVERRPDQEEERNNDLKRVAAIWDEMYGLYCIVGTDQLVRQGYSLGWCSAKYHAGDGLEVLIVSACQETQVDRAKRFLELFPQPKNVGIVDALLKRSLEHGRRYDNNARKRAYIIEAARQLLEQEKAE